MIRHLFIQKDAKYHWNNLSFMPEAQLFQKRMRKISSLASVDFGP